VDAKSTTTWEFEDIMQHLVTHARQAMAAYGLQPLFSWDNNKIQKVADLATMGLTPAEVLPVPAYAPDLQKPIEHPWNPIKHGVQQQLLQPRSKRVTPSEARQIVEQQIAAISRQSIVKDVLSLPSTYLVVALAKGRVYKNLDGEYVTGTGGDWAPAKYS
jgi:hypothetical protein